MAFGLDTVCERQYDWRCPICRLAARARDGMVVLPNNPLIVTALQALSAGGPHARALDGGWRRSRGGKPVYEFWNGAGGRILAWVEAADEGSAWRDIESYSALTVDVAAALLAGLAAGPFRQSTSAPRREPVSLGAAVVINAKNYQRFGAERSAFARAIADECDKLERLRFDIISYPGHDPETRRWRYNGLSRSNVALIERVEEGEHDAPERPVANDRTACAHARYLRLGAWADHWFSTGGPMWTASVPQAIIQLDHRENRSADALAKKVALIISLSFAAARESKTMRMPVRTLLRRIGALRRLDAERSPHSGRIADRLEEALLRLGEDGLLESELLGERAAALRAAHRRWFEEWLDAEVIFRRPGWRLL